MLLLGCSDSQCVVDLAYVSMVGHDISAGFISIILRDTVMVQVGSNVLLTTICPLGPNGETRHCSSAELEAASPLRPVWPIAMANFMVVFHVLGSYQVSCCFMHVLLWYLMLSRASMAS